MDHLNERDLRMDGLVDAASTHTHATGYIYSQLLLRIPVPSGFSMVAMVRKQSQTVVTITSGFHQHVQLVNRVFSNEMNYLLKGMEEFNNPVIGIDTESGEPEVVGYEKKKIARARLAYPKLKYDQDARSWYLDFVGEKND
jgi:hypothetical protein